ncbi:MAG: GxxExxY protein [Anaerolineaceae bacterium]|nr:GxxExxY protein [Anaerolineaceae bacterium]
MQELDARTNDLSYEIIGAAIEVHRALGAGLLESIYEDALCIELDDRHIPYERQKDISLTYKGRQIGAHRLDLLVDDLVVVELKAVQRLESVHTAQVMTYLKITNRRLGLLINFNMRVLKQGIQRVIL